jgi:predicted Fe-Mo cluster-binding NifX family protein
MKMCIPAATHDGLSAEVYGHFGSAPYFAIYDTQNQQIQVVNNQNSHHTHGQCNPLGVLAEYGVDLMVTRGIGARAWQHLQAAGIKAYYTSTEKTVQDVIASFERQTLQEIQGDQLCQGHGCH